jgi:hypothetical protein
MLCLALHAIAAALPHCCSIDRLTRLTDGRPHTPYMHTHAQPNNRMFHRGLGAAAAAVAAEAPAAARSRVMVVGAGLRRQCLSTSAAAGGGSSSSSSSGLGEVTASGCTIRRSVIGAVERRQLQAASGVRVRAWVGGLVGWCC